VLLEDFFSKTQKLKFLLHHLSEEQIESLYSILMNSPTGQVLCEFYFQDDEKQALVEIVPENKIEVDFKPELIETLRAKMGSTQFLELQF
jgi:hypothetical protein